MEITRQKAVINTALLRKHSWNVCYAIMVGNDDLLNLALAASRKPVQSPQLRRSPL